MNEQYEREIDTLEDLYEAGMLTYAELQKELHDLDRSYRYAAEEAALEAYEQVLDYYYN